MLEIRRLYTIFYFKRILKKRKSIFTIHYNTCTFNEKNVSHLSLIPHVIHARVKSVCVKACVYVVLKTLEFQNVQKRKKN